MPHNVPLSQDVFDVMHTMRAMRRLKPDPVPDELIFKILAAGQAAASGGDTQRWKFLVLKDAVAKKKAVQGYYKKLFDEVVGPRYASSPVPPGVKADSFKRQHSAVEYLTDHYHEAPVWIVACLEGANPGASAGASIYPAVQNMVLSCRAVGLGTTLTNRHMFFQKEVDKALGLPEGVHSFAILPIGYPMGKFGPVKRAALKDVVYQDKWGQAYTAG